MYRALVFDLDDTLYLEREFVMSGYRAVARHLADHCGLSFETVISTMADTYFTDGRQSVFPALLARFPKLSLSIADLVEIYRHHKPEIRLYPGYRRLLRNLSREYMMGVITDGLPDVQAGKIRALGLSHIMNKIVYTWEYGAEKQKPHPFSFTLMLECLGTEPGAALYIGDNPAKDCRGAHAAGMPFVLVRYSRSHTDGTAVQEKPEYMIDSLFQLPQILQHMN